MNPAPEPSWTRGSAKKAKKKKKRKVQPRKCATRKELGTFGSQRILILLVPAFSLIA
jgi:hypothetical protein